MGESDIDDGRYAASRIITEKISRLVPNGWIWRRRISERRRIYFEIGAVKSGGLGGRGKAAVGGRKYRVLRNTRGYGSPRSKRFAILTGWVVLGKGQGS